MKKIYLSMPILLSVLTMTFVSCGTTGTMADREMNSTDRQQTDENRNSDSIGNLHISNGSGKGDAVAAGSSKILVRFAYPFEHPSLGPVAATVFEGPINAGRPLVSMDPRDDPVYIPMDIGPIQLTVLYTIAMGNHVLRFYYPDWNDAEVAARNTWILSANNFEPTYNIPSIGSIAQITWYLPEDGQGSVIVTNKSRRPVKLEAADLGPYGRRGSLENFAVGAAPGSSSLAAGSPSATFRLPPGRYRLSAQDLLASYQYISAVEAGIEAGTHYHWIITDGSGLEKDESLTAAANIDRLIQNWKITSNVPGAKVSLSLESTDASVPGFRDFELGITDSSGALGGKPFIANLINDLTYENAAKVSIKITVSKTGYVPMSQAINALTLMESGSDFAPARFDLHDEADETKPGATYSISGIPLYYGE
ncbi:MAG: hypothetical protein LBQ46_05705 [Treponema sp.]|nr:hypothetical protein [Treponema sp.]